MSRKPTRTGPWIRADRLPSLEEIAWLGSAEGEAVCAEMSAGGEVNTPAALQRWRTRLAPPRVAAAAQQVHLRHLASAKFSRSDHMLFDRVGLEQATDELTARWKAARFAGYDRVADFCCGIGGDALCMGQAAPAIAVDWSTEKLALARHNAGVYGVSLETVAADVSLERVKADAVHVDPDRRVEGPRRHDPQHGSPDLAELERIVDHYRDVAIKLSPGADFRELPFAAEIELISVRGDCRQAVAWTGQLQRYHRRASVLPAGESIEAAPEESLKWPAPAALETGRFILEPDPAVIRADLVGVLARRNNWAPIEPRVAWLVASEPAPSALVRNYRILETGAWSLARTRNWWPSYDVGTLEIKTRGFAGKPEDILRRMRLTGRQKRVLLLTRIGETATAILAERVNL